MAATHMMGFRQEFTGGFLFDDVAHRLSSDALVQQLAENIFERSQPVQIGQLYAAKCNTSPGTSGMYKDVLERLAGEKDIVIRSEDGSIRRRARYMHDSDWIERNRQGALFNSQLGLVQ